MTDIAALWWTTSVTVTAIITAPITALWIQRIADDRKALRQRRESIFRTLWVNRARHGYVVRVDALNMIDVEFHGEQKVIDAWADLFAHYKEDHNTAGTSLAEQARRHNEKYATLLYEISQVLGYQIGKTHIRDDVYRPDVHTEFDLMEVETRRSMRDILVNLAAMDALPVRFVGNEAQQTRSATPGAPKANG